MKVLVRGAAARLRAARASTSSSVEVLEPLGKGSLQQAFEELKEKLEKEGLFAAGAQAAAAHAAAAHRRRHLAHRRRHPGHPARACERALREPRDRDLPRARAGRRRRRRRSCAGIRALNRGGRLRRADRGPRRRQPRGPLGLQRGAGGARAGRVADPDHLRRRPRDRLHDRRLRGRPARAHAVGGGGARGRRPRTSCGARIDGAAAAAPTRRCGLRLARACARGSARVTQHRVFEAERGRIRNHAQRVDELARRARGGPRRARRSARAIARGARGERLEAFRWDRQIAARRERVASLRRAAAQRSVRASRVARAARARRALAGKLDAPVAARRARRAATRSSWTSAGRLAARAAEVAVGDALRIRAAVRARSPRA